MSKLLIADKDVAARKQMASLLIEAGYDVTVTDSAIKAVHNVLKENVQVLLLGMELDKLNSADLVPLFKKCNRNLMIILVADDATLPLMRKVREEGIFYHALRPTGPEGKDEIRQVVKCAIENLSRTSGERRAFVNCN